ncbi:hypothetical protein EON66_08455, partial [archaeon]
MAHAANAPRGGPLSERNIFDVYLASVAVEDIVAGGAPHAAELCLLPPSESAHTRVPASSHLARVAPALDASDAASTQLQVQAEQLRYLQQCASNSGVSLVGARAPLLRIHTQAAARRASKLVEEYFLLLDDVATTLQNTTASSYVASPLAQVARLLGDASDGMLMSALNGSAARHPSCQRERTAFHPGNTADVVITADEWLALRERCILATSGARASFFVAGDVTQQQLGGELPGNRECVEPLVQHALAMIRAQASASSILSESAQGALVDVAACVTMLADDIRPLAAAMSAVATMQLNALNKHSDSLLASEPSDTQITDTVVRIGGVSVCSTALVPACAGDASCSAAADGVPADEATRHGSSSGCVTPPHVQHRGSVLGTPLAAAASLLQTASASKPALLVKGGLRMPCGSGSGSNTTSGEALAGAGSILANPGQPISHAPAVTSSFPPLVPTPPRHAHTTERVLGTGRPAPAGRAFVRAPDASEALSSITARGGIGSVDG